MFNTDFYPTPENVIAQMLTGFEASGKTILEPSAGRGDIVSYLQQQGAEVIAVELNADLRKIVATKCPVIGEDFLKIESHQVSHVNAIVMNPPFSADEKHILHAWNIAPAGCLIIALCNLNTIENRSYEDRKKLGQLVDENGSYEDIGKAFAEADRRTGVEVAIIRLQKPTDNYKTEFEGFFMEDEPEETQANGIMPYNFVRDLVNRYIAAVKLFDEQLNVGVKMYALTKTFYSSELAFSCTEEGKPKARNEFKKDLQKEAWKFIFDKMNLQKYATRGLKEDINKFVESQSQIPFTMKNIYRMLEIVIGTTEQRMDKALLEVFDKLTEHYHENRFNVEGWKTNSHYLINQKFIMPYVAETSWGGETYHCYSHRSELIEDMQKALCYITGVNYDNCTPLYRFTDDLKPKFGQWYCWGFFDIRAYKKGTMHFKFQNEDLWAKFNQRIAKLKGYPLFEAKNPTSKKEKETRQHQNTETAKRYKPEVLFEVSI